MNISLVSNRNNLFRKVIITSIHTLKDETSLLGVISAVVFLNGMLSSLVLHPTNADRSR